MARLCVTEDSDDELPDLQKIIKAHTKRTIARPTNTVPPSPIPSTLQPSARARRSPQKKSTCFNEGGNAAQNDCNPAQRCLVLKATTSNPTSGRQIRLKAVNTEQSPIKLPLNDVSKLSKARQLGPVAASPAKTRATPKRAAKKPLDYGSSHLFAIDVDDEEDFEESIWCGSSSSQEDDGDTDRDLSESDVERTPKARSRERKAQDDRGVPKEVSDIMDVLNKRLGHFTLDDADEDKFVAKKSNPSNRALPELSRPSSSSDNDSRAILRFTPPRLFTSRQAEPRGRPITPPPASPSKSRLTSPSKKNKLRIPTPPLRPSLDAFWNTQTVNEWNDQYSPRKMLISPRKATTQDSESSPSTSPRKSQSPTKKTRAEVEARRLFEARKHKLAKDFLDELDQRITDGRIKALSESTGGVHLKWSKTLNSTAGRANWRRETNRRRNEAGETQTTIHHHASIELAEKVIDDEERLINVIAHEFCHLANFMVSGIKDQPHGRQFKQWGSKCSKAFGDRGVDVTTKHSYQIDYKYIWACSNDMCGHEFKRHSKSIDTSRHTCGACRSKLLQIKPVPRKDAGNSGYAGFVKEHFATVKKENSGASQKEVMEILGRKYREWKADAAASRMPEAEKEDRFDVDKVARVLEFVTLDD
ncbi:hypothetical protein LTR50_007223 [Elasticomyces elasticus]|nr:hypothetical protein LTR50_007223 [Elasticomyces elasticus]